MLVAIGMVAAGQLTFRFAGGTAMKAVVRQRRFVVLIFNIILQASRVHYILLLRVIVLRFIIIRVVVLVVLLSCVLLLMTASE